MWKETPNSSASATADGPVALIVGRSSLSRVDDAAYLLRRINDEFERGRSAFDRLPPVPGKPGKLAFYDVGGADVVVKDCGYKRMGGYSHAYLQGAGNELYDLFFECHRDMADSNAINPRRYAAVPILQYGSITLDGMYGEHVYIVMERMAAVWKPALHSASFQLAVADLSKDAQTVREEMSAREDANPKLPERWIAPPQVRDAFALGNTSWYGGEDDRWVLALPRDFQ